METIEQINDKLAAISDSIFPEASSLSLRYVALDAIREQDLNAQSMTKAMFDQLEANIRDAGVMESVPLCATIEGMGDQIWMISGHHRKRAASAAGQTHMLILLYEGLSPYRVRSKQLAHNAPVGKSDIQLVKRIWEQIDDVKARFEAFIDPRSFDNIPAPVRFTPVDVNMANLAKTVLIVFLPVQHSDFETALATAMPNGEVDQIYLASKETYDQWMNALKAVRDDLEIVAVPTALAAMARLAMERLEQITANADL